MGKFDKGRKFRVVKPDARLTGWTPVQGGQRGWGKDLNVGDVIVSLGVTYSGGGDGIMCPHFESEVGPTLFNPSSWGMPLPDYLVEVPNG